MNRFILWFFPVLILFGCGQDESITSPPAIPVADAASSSLSGDQTGQRTYERVCARCHAEGLEGAPKVGDRAAWDDRSRQWEAVLFEHARNGFGEMPARGGESTLDEAAVSKAAEYMMSLTYPEMPQG